MLAVTLPFFAHHRSLRLLRCDNESCRVHICDIHIRIYPQTRAPRDLLIPNYPNKRTRTRRECKNEPSFSLSLSPLSYIKSFTPFRQSSVCARLLANSGMIRDCINITTRPGTYLYVFYLSISFSLFHSHLKRALSSYHEFMHHLAHLSVSRHTYIVHFCC